MVDFRFVQSHGRWDSQTWSFTIGWVFGIRVRVHIFLAVLAFFMIARDVRDLGWPLAFMFSVPMQAMLWTAILLHEFGHCFGCRSVGGSADDILMWPLGGLASCRPPRQPIPSLITTLSGPAVNLAFVILLIPVVALIGGALGSLLNPFGNPFAVVDIAGPAWKTYIVLFFKVNYFLFLFNMLLPIFPFDLGRAIQELLWLRVGYMASMAVATNVGMLASLLLLVAAIYLAGAVGADFFLLAGIALFGFVQCITTRRELEMNAAMNDNEFGYDFSEGYTSLERESYSGELSTRPRVSLSPLAAWRAWRQRRRAAYAERVEVELDRILTKIHDQGLGSLSRGERKMLEAASNRRRARE